MPGVVHETALVGGGFRGFRYPCQRLAAGFRALYMQHHVHDTTPAHLQLMSETWQQDPEPTELRHLQDHWRSRQAPVPGKARTASSDFGKYYKHDPFS